MSERRLGECETVETKLGAKRYVRSYDGGWGSDPVSSECLRPPLRGGGVELDSFFWSGGGILKPGSHHGSPLNSEIQIVCGCLPMEISEKKNWKRRDNGPLAPWNPPTCGGGEYPKFLGILTTTTLFQRSVLRFQCFLPC